MNIDANRVIQKLSQMGAMKDQRIAILEAQVEQLQAENAELKKDEDKAAEVVESHEKAEGIKRNIAGGKHSKVE